MDLADYERRKFDLAEVVRAAAAPDSPLSQAEEERHRELFARLAEDRFNLAVVGRSSRGKSSLMNAIFGSDHLPTDIVPLTSVITSVGYGSEPCAVISFEGAMLRHEVKLEELAHYVTQQGNPGNVQRVKLAEVQVPAEILRRGFYFVDTPGVGSAIAANTRTTEKFLPASDAMLLVTGFDGPLSDDEIRLLEWARAASRRVFVAVNKHDTVGPEDRQRTLEYVRVDLAERFGVCGASVFSTSATDGLTAKIEPDQKALAASGVPALEQALIAFLVEHKRATFLLNMCARVDEALAELSPTPHRIALIARLRSLWSALNGDSSGRTAASIGGLVPARPETAGSCEVCRAADEATFDFLRHFQYEIATSETEQTRLAETGGLCPLHSWWFYNLASPHGLSVGLPKLIERWSRELADLTESAATNGAEAAELLEAHRSIHCPACREEKRAESESLAKAAERLNQGGDQAVNDLSAICLWHLPALLRLTDDAVTRQVLRRQAGLFERTAEDMRRYAVKREGLRRGLLSRSEEQSTLRTIRLLAGLQNLRFSNRRD